MWIFAKEGFFSVIEDATDKTKVFVRAREREDLAALRLGVKIHETPDADYGFRSRVTKRRWADKMFNLTLAIDYPNFKNAAPIERKKLYEEVWMTMSRLQKIISPYGTKGFEVRDQVAKTWFNMTPLKKRLKRGKSIKFHPNRLR